MAEEKLIYDISEVPRYTELAERFMFPFSQLNWFLNGGILDRVTLITSETDNGKTTLTSQILMSVIEQGYNVCAFLGEDTPREAVDRLFRQALSKNQSEIVYKPYIDRNGKETNTGEFILSDLAYSQALEKFKGKLKLYNSLKSATVEKILEGFEIARKEHKARIFILDNVDQFEFASENENKELKDSIIKIRNYAINHKVHIFLVSHIRKMERDVLVPTLADVKGTSSLVNIAKNVIVILRTDKMDKSSKSYKSLKKLVELNNYDLDQADALIKVLKTKGRKLGFVALNYNPITNSYWECKKLDETKENNIKEKAIVTQQRQSSIELIPIDDDLSDIF